MDGAKEDLVDMFIVHTVEEIQVLFGIQNSADKYRCDIHKAEFSLQQYVELQ